MKSSTSSFLFSIISSTTFLSIILYPLPPFDLSIFINKLFDTGLEIIVLVVGFVLLNVYWNRREENRKSAPYYEYFKSQIEFIEKTSSIMSELAHQSFSPEKHDEVSKRNSSIKKEIERLEVIKNAIEKVITAGYEKLDSRTAKGFAYYQTYIEPIVEKIIQNQHAEIQPSLVVLDSYFKELEKLAKQIIKNFKEDKQ